MLGRWKDQWTDQRAGAYHRSVLEPMASHLGVDNTDSIFTPPTTEAALALETYRCGLSLLIGFTYRDGWGTDPPFGDATLAKEARKAAKAVHASLRDDYGRYGISHMAQRFAHETAAMWRRAADSGESSENAVNLRQNAERSDALGAIAARHWPVRDEFGALGELDAAARNRFFKLDNPDAMIDVQSAAARTQAACEAVAVALGPRFETFVRLLIGPVMRLNLELAQLLAVDWNFHMDHWLNLISDEPIAYSSICELQALADEAMEDQAPAEPQPPAAH